MPATERVRIARWKLRGREVWRVIRQTGSGKGQRRVVCCASEQEARDAADLAVQQIEAGALTGPVPRTVADLVESTIAAKRNVVPGSLAAYQTRAIHLRARIGALPLARVTRQTVERYVEDRLHEAPANPVRGEVQLLASAFRYAQDKGWWTGDRRGIFMRHRYPETAEVEWLRADELRKLLKFLARQPRTSSNYLSAFLASRGGLRADECLHVRWEDWREQDRVLRLQAWGDWPGPKGGKSRDVPVSTDLAAVLRAERERQEAAEFLEPPVTIVVDRHGSRIRDTGILRKGVMRACVRCKIPPVTFHALRHTFATLALESGSSIVDVSRILGHRSVDFTARMYVHVSRERMAEVADRLDAHLRAPANSPQTANIKAV